MRLEFAFDKTHSSSKYSNGFSPGKQQQQNKTNPQKQSLPMVSYAEIALRENKFNVIQRTRLSVHTREHDFRPGHRNTG